MTDKGMKKALRLVLQVLINAVIILILIRVFMYAYDFSYKVFTDNCLNPMNKSEVQFVIAPDSTTMEIVDLLVEEELVDDRYVLLAKVYLSSYHGKMMPGTYTLSPSMTQDEILKTITGTVVKEEEEE